MTLQTCHSNRETLAASSSCWLRSSSEAVAKTTNKDGGARRIRTDDILLAKQALYQLSYGPFAKASLVGPTRFELVTSRLSSVRSNQLSYGPIGRSKITALKQR